MRILTNISTIESVKQGCTMYILYERTQQSANCMRIFYDRLISTLKIQCPQDGYIGFFLISNVQRSSDSIVFFAYQLFIFTFALFYCFILCLRANEVIGL